MARYRRRYRSWRGRGYSSNPTKYDALTGLFGEAVADMRKAFLTLDEYGVSLDIENYCTVSLFFEQTYL